MKSRNYRGTQDINNKPNDRHEILNLGTLPVRTHVYKIFFAIWCGCVDALTTKKNWLFIHEINNLCVNKNIFIRF